MTKHTHPVVFGRKVEGCPRCNELQQGAPPRSWGRRPYHDPRKFPEPAHVCTAKCGPVCTAGEW